MGVHSAGGLLLLRARDSAAALGALGAVVFVSTLALGLTLGSVQHGAAAGARETLANAAARDSAVRFTTHLADDAVAQSDAARALVARLFPAGSVAVHDGQRARGVDLVGEPGVSVVLGVEPDLLENASVTAGDWPAEGAAVQEDAAAALGLSVGDSFTVGDAANQVPLTVAATWRADDPADAYWFADSLAGSGRDGADLGLVVVQPEALVGLPTQVFASWTVTAEPSALDDGTRDAVAAGFEQLPDAIKADDGVVSISSDIEGSLPSTLAAISSASRGAAAIATSAICIVGVLGIVAVLQLCTVLTASRRRHTDLARARGLSIGQLVASSAGEGLLAVIPGAALGAVAAVALLAGRSVAEVAVVAGAVAVASLGCLVGVALSDARAGRPGDSAARSPAGFFIAGGVIAVVAALATWQLYSRGGSGTDLVAATSPALTLVAVTVIGTALLIPFAPALARARSRRGSFVAVLAARQVAGRVVRYVVPVLALAIAIASAVFATGIATTWAATQRSAQFTGTGGAVVVSFPDEQSGAVTSATLADLDDVDAASALVLSTVTVGADTVPFVALHPGAAVRVLGPQALPFATALETTTPDASGFDIEPGAPIAATLTSTGDGRAPVATFAIAVWAADPQGALVRVPLLAGETASALTGTAPGGTGPWRVLAAESQRTGAADPSVTRLTVTVDSQEPVAINAQARATSRGFVGEIDDSAPLPVVVTSAYAERVGAAVGDPLTVELDVSGASVESEVAAIVDAMPGVASRLGIATDLRALNLATLRNGAAPVAANAVSVATSHPQRVAAAVSRGATDTALVATEASTSQQPVLAPALAAFWLAAIAAGLLAIVALAAFLVDDMRGRRGEISVLRALGFSSRAQSRTRGAEQAVVLVFALVVGAAGGALATAATVGPFLAAVVPAAAAYVRIWPAFDVVPWLIFCAGLALVTATVCFVVLRLVRRDATRTVDEERAS
jgi:hypothetical protein